MLLFHKTLSFWLNFSRAILLHRHNIKKIKNAVTKTESWTKQDRSPIQPTDLYELLISLCTIIIVHNTVTQRQFTLIFHLLQTNITSQMWPSWGKGVETWPSWGKGVETWPSWGKGVETTVTRNEYASPKWQCNTGRPCKPLSDSDEILYG